MEKDREDSGRLFSREPIGTKGGLTPFSFGLRQPIPGRLKRGADFLFRERVPGMV